MAANAPEASTGRPAPAARDANAEHWQAWGADDAYFGVLTDPRFRRGALTRAAHDEFFRSGALHVRQVIETGRLIAGPSWLPAQVLDFGCGVGRTLLAFARGAEHALGIDIADSMRAEAALNAAAAGVHNIELAATLADVAHGRVFDLVHSYIVLQHIRPDIGLPIVRELLRRIRPGGLGALHFTFAGGSRPAEVPARPRAGADPVMMMYEYPLTDVFSSLLKHGVEALNCRLTDHGGALGAFVFFRMPRVRADGHA